MAKHQHAELIKAWADGADIEYLNIGTDSVWTVVSSPRWDGSGSYRIKREPKPDIIILTQVEIDPEFYVRKTPFGEMSHLRFVFCGETGRLKTAENL